MVSRVKLHINYGLVTLGVLIPITMLIHMIFPMLVMSYQIYLPLHQSFVYYGLIVVISLILTVYFLYNPFRKPRNVEVSDEMITLPNGQSIFKKYIDTVLFDTDTMILMRGKEMTYSYELECSYFVCKKLQRILRAHGYLVTSKDPYNHEYVKWRPNHPDLPVEVNHLINKMRYAFRDDDYSEGEDIRQELRQKYRVYVKGNRNVSFRKIL